MNVARLDLGASKQLCPHALAPMRCNRLQPALANARRGSPGRQARRRRLLTPPGRAAPRPHAPADASSRSPADQCVVRAAAHVCCGGCHPARLPAGLRQRGVLSDDGLRAGRGPGAQLVGSQAWQGHGVGGPAGGRHVRAAPCVPPLLGDNAAAHRRRLTRLLPAPLQPLLARRGHRPQGGGQGPRGCAEGRDGVCASAQLPQG